MKTLRIVLMSLAVVIAVGAAFASNSKLATMKYVSSNSNGTGCSLQDVTIPANCAVGNSGDQCQVPAGETHSGKYIFNTQCANPLRKPL